MSITLDASPAQVPYQNGTAVFDDAFPGARANVIAAGLEQSDITRPNDCLHKVGEEQAAAEPALPAAPAVGAAKAKAAYRSNTLSRGQHKDRINAAWLKGTAAYIEAGEYLVVAKAELERNAFEVLTRKELHFDPSTGRRLMCIARNEVLCAHAHKLPPSWMTAYELSKLDDDTLKAAIADGRVNPKMERKDAVAIRKPPKPADEDEDQDSGADQDTAPQESKVEVFRKAWMALSEPERGEFVQGEKIENFLKAMSTTQRDDLLERLIGQQIANASSTAAPANSKKLLNNLTGTFHWGLAHADPQAFTIINGKLKAARRSHTDICIAWARNGGHAARRRRSASRDHQPPRCRSRR